ncbi:PASTA domain-containing protein [Kribbella sp. NPDC004138]
MTVTGISFGSAGGVLVGVPNVVGLQQAAAETKLRDFELVPRVQTIEAEGAEGAVFSQNPAANTAKPKNTVVTLLIIKAPVIPPDLGQQLTDIKTAVGDVDTKVDQVVPEVQAVGLQVTGVQSTADGIATELTTVDANVTAVGTKLDGITTTVDEIAAAVDGLGTKIDTISTAVADLETDAAAETRKQAILDKLDTEVKTGSSTAKRPGGTGR